MNQGGSNEIAGLNMEVVNTIGSCQSKKKRRLASVKWMNQVCEIQKEQ